MDSVFIALGLTLIAGMATGIGSVIAFTAKRTDYRLLSVATGFSAGVMLYVSFVEIFPESTAMLAARYGESWGSRLVTASFFGGMILMALIDNVIPAAENPHETHSEEETAPLHDPKAALPDFPSAAFRDSTHPKPGVHDHGPFRAGLLRTGLLTALAITIHNFPEGIATFLAAMQEPALGAAIAVAVALHNIPEGISVSVPIFYATGSRKKAFWWSFASGLAEPLGAVAALAVITLITGGGAWNPPVNLTGFLFGGIAGVMVYISLDELLPTSRAYSKGHDSILGLMAGMMVMAISLLLMR
ncbi:MAG: zinc transporter ZupT [Smithellaceae bacterium]|jgi:ZIP family zinc transporter|nr:zinc transporter ZupT [Smithellaceae bacterium]MDD3259064.1 zinc transporter ZupT [Smithellaceae bacterium]MDD3847732.1 zinc transporter ZupT [Smithellaceae bacterium]HOG12059.1 zinc transporter ZupT [Smithellaceae bacterium]HOQ72486.1 zinc transporter ZupT [Smithellaceae bacterium]